MPHSRTETLFLGATTSLVQRLRATFAAGRRPPPRSPRFWRSLTRIFCATLA